MLGGDGKADNLGHSAKYGLYIFVELTCSKVVDFNLLRLLGCCIPPFLSIAESAQVTLPLPVVNVIDSNSMTTGLEDSFERF